jgi:hypothetical protein
LRVAASRQLSAPGRSYVEALGTVYQAAAHTLGLGNIPRQLFVEPMRISVRGGIILLTASHCRDQIADEGFISMPNNIRPAFYAACAITGICLVPAAVLALHGPDPAPQST